MKRICVLGCLLLNSAYAALFSPSLLLANPLDNFGFGSKWVAMGGAATALANDVGAVYYNPAGVVQAEQVCFTIGYFNAPPSLEINNYDIHEDTVSGIVAGVITPPMKIYKFKFGGGAAIHIPDKRVARSLAIPYDQPTFVMYGARNQRMVAQFPFALEIFPWLSIGGAISMFVKTGGGPDFLLRENRPDNQGLWSEGSISATQKGTFFPTAGLMFHPTKRLHLGFCYKAKNEILYEVPLRVTIEPLHIGLPFPVLGESYIDMDQHVYTFFAPEQFSFGCGYQITEDMLLGLDVTLALWSAFRQPSPEGATVYSGGIAVLVPPNPNYPLPPPDFSDILIPALGIQYRVYGSSSWELFLRSGYRFRPSPAPDPTGWNNFLDNDTHVFSGGIGIQFLRIQELLKVMRGPISLDAHVQYFLLQERRINKVHPVWDAYGDIQYGGHVLNLGITLNLCF
jgi:long-subunit fatty acid transport protein